LILPKEVLAYFNSLSWGGFCLFLVNMSTRDKVCKGHYKSAVKILGLEERENTMDINDDIRTVIIKIKAVIDDERVAEDEGIALDTRKVEGIRQLLNQFYNKYGAEFET
jgi:hypothetical protein